MGGLWVDYNLMSNVPGLFVLGEANFSDHGANRLGASALMQGLADGYFVLPATLADYLAGMLGTKTVSEDDAAFKQAEASVADQTKRYLSTNGKHSVDYFHKELGKIVWDRIGMERDKAGLESALRDIPALRADFERDVKVLGDAESMNDSLEKAFRVADFFDLAELMARDALYREESCGGHFRVEHQFTEADSEVQAGKTQSGEAKRHDDKFCHVSAWEYKGEGAEPVLHKEPLEFEAIHLSIRSYA